MPQTAIIIGAGPAGLTAATEFLTRSDIRPIVLEQTSMVGGISRTVEHHGNRMDIGGHRFFSKSNRVVEWWLRMLPLEGNAVGRQKITYQRSSRTIDAAGAGPDPEQSDEVMLLRQRKSRIYFLRTFFDYPIKLSPDTLRKLGFARTLRIGFSYLRAVIFPPRQIQNLEQFIVSNFGEELYKTFFKSYTEKVWGVPCSEISAEWGQQRIKGLNIFKAIKHFFTQLLKPAGGANSIKDVETSLIEQFLYPKFGPGQMWQVVAKKVIEGGGEVRIGHRVKGIHTDGDRVIALTVTDEKGQEYRLAGDHFFSTMPIQELVRNLDCPVPDPVRSIADGLLYRDFITVGILVDRLKIREADGSPVSDNWIYIQEPDVLAGRLQVFNNWSPYLVADPSKTWLGVEYFCYKTDPLWSLSDSEMAALAIAELAKIGILERAEALDHHVIRVPKAYPAYFGSYEKFDVVQTWIDRFDNLFLVGRNGMHKYNNQDHSMLTAMTAVDNLLNGRTDKSNIWKINTEMEAHEE